MDLRKILSITALAISTMAIAETYVILHLKSGATEKVAVSTSDEMAFTETTLSLKGNQYDLSTIDHITLSDEEAEVQSDIVRVTWSEGAAPQVMGAPADVVVSIDGGNVTLTNSNTTTEYTYILAGKSTDGSFTLVSDYKSTIQLDGLQLQSSLEEALNLKCGKRVALVVSDGTTNTLADATADNGQKGAIYCKGHLELSGAGVLNLSGHVKHALSTKEYLLIKKTFGTLNITGAANDGIHAGQYFQMNGGTIAISGIGGDGIQAEATNNTEDELNGQMIIKGGSINITTTGAGVKALKCKDALTISGGDFTINQIGKASIEAGDLDYVTAIKGGDVSISGGTFHITTSGAGARGISAGNLRVSDSADIYITNSGAGGTSSDAVEKTEQGSSTTDPEVEKSYKVYVNVPTSTQGGGGFPGGSQNSAWSTVYLYKQDGTQVATLTQQVSVNGTTFYVYDFTKADSGTYYFGAPNYSSGGNWGGGTTYTIKSGTFTGPTSGKDYFYKVASNYSTSGTTRTYSISDVTSTYEGGTIGGVSSSDSFTAKGIKVDGDAHLDGGTISISMSGSGGKGIKVEGNYTQGTEDGSGPTLTIATTGSSYGSGSGSSTGGGNRPGGGGFPGEDSSGSSSKAIKVQGLITIYGGQTEVSTSTDGAEGLESKQKVAGSIQILGGQHYFKCYDDCINSAGGIVFDGGTTVCYATGNDAVDSNFGQKGAIVIGNGNVLAYSTKGSPEEGFDCDNNSYIQITGAGHAVGLGGAQGGSASSSLGSATQGYAVLTSSMSLASGRYYTLADASGNNLLTFSVEAAFSSTMSVITATGMKSGSSYTLKYSTTAPTDATTAWHGLYLGSSAQGTTQSSSFTAK